VPGWDCHGLPIELKALEKVGHQIQNHSPLKDIDVRNAARKLATRTVAQQMKGFQSWGVMADFESHWKTMDKDFEIKQLEVFREMAKKGLISRRYKPVYWSPSSKTALAETELEYKDDHESTAAYVRFPITKLSDALRGKLSDDTKLSALIWTTTPWTLPANKAIAVHSQLEYCIVTHGTDNLIIAKSRLQETFPYAPIVVDSITGAELEGTQYLNALGGRNSQAQPIIHADFVSADSGSGLVHCAPGHGMDDYEVCTSLGIEAFAPVDDFGCFTQSAFPDDPEALKGKPVLAEGSLKVLKLLGDKVILTEKHKHRYPYDGRKNLPVIIRATEQWFADVGSIKNDALQRLKAVHFIPESGQRRLESFVKGRSEWCISRQRAWGVPVPALYRKDDGVAVLTDASISHIIKVIDEKGMDAWWIDAPNDPAWVVPGLIGEYIRGKDTMDVWFDSGISWTQTAKQADLYVEGTDQHRGWFQSSLLTHVGTSGKDYAPYKAVITHGFVLDNFGKKMSKSIGNVISPDEIMSGSILDNVGNSSS
jgi:isoleucyl-tRNA synthetase